MLKNATRWLNAIGLALSIAAAGYFAWEITSALDWSDANALIETNGPMILLALGLYLLAFVPMVVGWHTALRICGVTISKQSAARIFLVSQFAKYVPGNVGHLIGRAILARADGVSTSTASAAMLVEVVGVLIAACLMIGFAVSMGAEAVAGAPLLLLTTCGVITVCGGGAAFILRKQLHSIRFDPTLGIGLIGLFIAVFALVCSSQMVLLGALTNSGLDQDLLLLLTSAILVSWLAGFLAPGAPAGLGVREVSLTVLLSDLLPHDQVLVAAAGMRIVTLAGDGAMWALGLNLPRSVSSPKNIENKA